MWEEVEGGKERVRGVEIGRKVVDLEMRGGEFGGKGRKGIMRRGRGWVDGRNL